ncbi:MAG: hypothetical protein JWP01_3086 [Myxococcales bacterium]|nr:hypothetical protein [Myxococcales bacterium]
MGRLARRGLLYFAAALVGLAGCAQLAGIDQTSSTDPDLVSLTVERISIGATVSRAPQDLSASSASFLVEDEAAVEGFTRVPADLADVNVWTAPIATGTPPVQFDLPDFPTPRQHVWELPSRTFSLGYSVYEHPNPTPAPDMASLTVGATLPTPYVAGEAFTFFSAGTWNARGFTGTELPVGNATVLGPTTFPFSSTSKITGRPHEKITTADAVFVLRYLANRLSGVMQADPFDQTGTDTVMGALTEVPADRTLDVTIAPDAVAARYVPLRPTMGPVNRSWNLAAAPGVDVSATLGIQLHAGSVAATAPGALTATYGNPFEARGWRTVLLWATSATRTTTPPTGTLPVTLRAELFTYTEPTAGMMLTLPVGLPELITFDGMPLSTDHLMIPRPTRSAKISMSAAGTDTMYQVQLFELVPNMANTALEYQFVIDATSTTKDLMLPPEVFVPGKLYTIRASAMAGGYANIADGDLSTRTLPLSVGFLDSGVFSVLP